MHAQKQRIGYGITKAEAARIRRGMTPKAEPLVGAETRVASEGIFAGLMAIFK